MLKANWTRRYSYFDRVWMLKAPSFSASPESAASKVPDRVTLPTQQGLEDLIKQWDAAIEAQSDQVKSFLDARNRDFTNALKICKGLVSGDTYDLSQRLDQPSREQAYAVFANALARKKVPPIRLGAVPDLKRRKDAKTSLPGKEGASVANLVPLWGRDAPPALLRTMKLESHNFEDLAQDRTRLDKLARGKESTESTVSEISVVDPDEKKKTIAPAFGAYPIFDKARVSAEGDDEALNALARANFEEEFPPEDADTGHHETVKFRTLHKSAVLGLVQRLESVAEREQQLIATCIYDSTAHPRAGNDQTQLFRANLMRYMEEQMRFFKDVRLLASLTWSVALKHCKDKTLEKTLKRALLVEDVTEQECKDHPPPPMPDINTCGFLEAVSLNVGRGVAAMVAFEPCTKLGNKSFLDRVYESDRTIDANAIYLREMLGHFFVSLANNEKNCSVSLSAKLAEIDAEQKEEILTGRVKEIKDAAAKIISSDDAPQEDDPKYNIHLLQMLLAFIPAALDVMMVDLSEKNETTMNKCFDKMFQFLESWKARNSAQSPRMFVSELAQLHGLPLRDESEDLERGRAKRLQREFLDVWWVVATNI